MDVLFLKVFNHIILKNLIFKNVHHIYIDILKIKKTLKWNDVIYSRYALAGNGYLYHLKEYYSKNNSDDLRFNRKQTVLLNAFKSKSLDIIMYIIEELKYDYNSYGCYNDFSIHYSGHDILYIASKYGNIEIIKYIDSLKNNSSNWNYVQSFKVAPLSNDISALHFIYDKLVENGQILDDYLIKCSILNSLIIGRIDMVEWLIDLSDTINLNDFEYIKAAIKSGKMDVVQFCMTHMTLQHRLQNLDLISIAAEKGYMHIIKWLYTNKLSNISYRSYQKASLYRHWDVVNWLYENNKDTTISDLSTIQVAAMDGQLDIYRKLMQVFSFPTDDVREIDGYLMANAASSGNIEMVKWLHENRIQCDGDGAMDAAAKNGHLDLVKWLHVNRTEGCSIDAMDYAAYKGNLELLKWFHHNRTEGCTTNAMNNAAYNGHLETIKWLQENRTEGCTTEAMNSAASNGHLETIKWLHDNRTEGCKKMAMDLAAYNGHLETIKWLHHNRKVGSNNAMDFAAINGHLEIIKWLHHNRTERSCTFEAMDCAAQNGYFEIVKWLHHNRTEGCTTKAFNDAAENGHLDIVKWLHHNRTEGATIAIDNASLKGHIEIVKWLHHNRSEDCTTKAMDNAALNGHFEIVKWLHKNRTEGCTPKAMDGAAMNGHLEIVKWLHQNRTEGSTTNAMRKADMYGHIEIIIWLRENIKESMD